MGSDGEDVQDVFARPKNPAAKKKRHRKDSDLSTVTVESTKSSLTSKKKRKGAYNPDEESR